MVSGQVLRELHSYSTAVSNGERLCGQCPPSELEVSSSPTLVVRRGRVPDHLVRSAEELAAVICRMLCEMR